MPTADIMLSKVIVVSVDMIVYLSSSSVCVIVAVRPGYDRSNDR